MHIGSGFLSPPVWGTMAAVSGAAVAEARHPLAELVTGVGHRQRICPVEQAVAGEDVHPLLVR